MYCMPDDNGGDDRPDGPSGFVVDINEASRITRGRFRVDLVCLGLRSFKLERGLHLMILPAEAEKRAFGVDVTDVRIWRVLLPD